MTFQNGKMDDDTLSIMPYFGYQIMDFLSLDLIGGYARSKKDGYRRALDLATGLTTGEKITSKPVANRIFAAPTLTVSKSINALNLAGNIGYIYANNRQNAFTESNNETTDSLDTRLSRFTSGLNFGYRVNNMVEPYLALSYARDLLADRIANTTTTSTQAASGTDKNTYGAGAGLNMAVNNALTGNIGYDYQKNGTLKINSVKVMVRYAF